MGWFRIPGIDRPEQMLSLASFSVVIAALGVLIAAVSTGVTSYSVFLRETVDSQARSIAVTASNNISTLSASLSSQVSQVEYDVNKTASDLQAFAARVTQLESEIDRMGKDIEAIRSRGCSNIRFRSSGFSSD